MHRVRHVRPPADQSDVPVVPQRRIEAHRGERAREPLQLVDHALRRQSGFRGQIPYVVLVVELAEQPGLKTIGNLVGTTPTDLAIGEAVEVTFEKINDEVTLPQWKLDEVGG